MVLSAFDDKTKMPTPNALEEEIGRTYTHWVNLREHIAETYPPLTET